MTWGEGRGGWDGLTVWRRADGKVMGPSRNYHARTTVPDAIALAQAIGIVWVSLDGAGQTQTHTITQVVVDELSSAMDRPFQALQTFQDWANRRLGVVLGGEYWAEPGAGPIPVLGTFTCDQSRGVNVLDPAYRSIGAMRESGLWARVE